MHHILYIQFLQDKLKCRFGLKLIHMNQNYIFHFSSLIVSKNTVVLGWGRVKTGSVR